MSFKVNDKVTVVDSGKTYSTYRDWMEEHGKRWVSQWNEYGSPSESKEYIVVAKANHSKYGGRTLYLIQCDDKVYIIGERGIKAVETIELKVLTLKEAMKQCLDGHKVVPVNHNHPKSHMFFDDCKGFMWYSEPLGYTEKAEAIFSRTQWVLWTEPPKFAVNSLVYNTDGTIGKVVEDKGIYKGIRRYSVSFNAIRDAVKSVDETELTEYKQ